MFSKKIGGKTSIVGALAMLSLDRASSASIY
jgi:hypothetical protein